MFAENFRRIQSSLKVSDVQDIARRYFVMNAFDGALTMLGIVVGAYVAGMREPAIIIAAGLSGSVAMGISGFSGAYMTEQAERTRSLKTLESAMLSDLSKSIHGDAGHLAAIATSLVDGLSPAVGAIFIIIPFFLVRMNMLNYDTAFYLSMAMAAVFLFALGAYLSVISQERILKNGLKMLAVGVVTAVITSAISRLVETPLPIV
ncbi:VIT family protein [uncultured archaeon]|nr:VIT family protein [uncultured archaeon]